MGLELYISSEELKQFIMDSSNSHVLLKKYNPTKSKKLLDLTDTERRVVIREAVNLLVKKFKYHPEPEHKHALALAIIKLFPQLETHNSKIQGVDLLYNREENRGYILSRLYHVRNKLYKHESDSIEIESNTKLSKRRLKASEKNKFKKVKYELSIPKNIEEELLILKHLNVTSQQDEIKEKLKITLNHRDQKLKSQDGITISIDFPFFITCPELILFDYDLRYPDTSTAFIDKWSNVHDNVEVVWKGFKKPGTEFLEIEDWLPSYQTIFMLLNLLPETSLGKLSAKSKRLTFQESMERIIVFKPLNSTPDELKNQQLTSPYLIAVGESKQNISEFLLCIENELIPLPASFEIKKSIDILFKSHYVFNQHFDGSLKNFWRFISCYFFEIGEKSIPTKIRDVINKLNIALANNQ